MTNRVSDPPDPPYTNTKRALFVYGRKPKKASKTKKSLPKRPAEPLTKDEAWKLIFALSRSTATGLRNRAVLIMLWRAGLRISEALSARLADFDFEECTVRVLHGKGDKARTASFDRECVAFLDSWIERRKQLGLPSDAPLFCTMNGKRIHSGYFRTLLPRLAKKVGIGKRVHPHGFRHTHAVELLREGNNVKLISSQLGHTNLSTTATYLNHLAPADIAKTIRNRKLDCPDKRWSRKKQRKKGK